MYELFLMASRGSWPEAPYRANNPDHTGTFEREAAVDANSLPAADNASDRVLDTHCWSGVSNIVGREGEGKTVIDRYTKTNLSSLIQAIRSYLDLPETLPGKKMKLCLQSSPSLS